MFVGAAFGASQKKAPDFTLKSLDGKNISLSMFKSSVVVINFWASWCPPCKAEIPDFVKTYEKLKNKNFIIIGIAVGSREAEVRKLVEENKISYPVVLSDKKVEDLYGGIRAVPTTFVVGKDGTIVDKKVGMFMEGELEKTVLPLLK